MLVPVSTDLAPTPSFPRGIRVETLPVASEVVRIHLNTNGPVWFGPAPGLAPKYRFDAPSGEYRVCYAAQRLEGAFVESILHGCAKTTILARAFVEERSYCHLKVGRDLRLAKLYDDGLLFHCTDAAISACDDYAEPRRVALALFTEAATPLDGIAYRSRHNNGELCFALFSRVDPSDLPEAGSPSRFDMNQAIVDQLALKYGMAFDTSKPVPKPSESL